MKFFYSVGVNLYTFAIRVASLWNSKAKKWVSGRNGVWKKIEEFEPTKHVIWFHCASLGEFEQGRPLMEAIKLEQNAQIVVTFYSPSGYEIRRDYKGADLIVYLPKDSKRNAQRFLKAIQPKHIFFIKYEFWAHYILEAKALNIPIYSVAALFRKDQIFFKGHGGFMRTVLKSFTKIFVQNEASQKLLSSIEIESEVCGDTRYDRVMQNSAKVEAIPSLGNFKGAEKVLVCGSIWMEDLEVIKETLSNQSNWKVIVAPHELSESFLSKIEASIQLKSIRYSNMQAYSDERMIIIDNIGMLMNVYQYGDVAYVGGAFRTGLHNILEPAAFGLPVIFGNKYEKFPEAFEFLEENIARSVNNAADFRSRLELHFDTDIKDEVKAFMKKREGATDKVMAVLTP